MKLLTGLSSKRREEDGNGLEVLSVRLAQSNCRRAMRMLCSVVCLRLFAVEVLQFLQMWSLYVTLNYVHTIFYQMFFLLFEKRSLCKNVSFDSTSARHFKKLLNTLQIF